MQHHPWVMSKKVGSTQLLWIRGCLRHSCKVCKSALSLPLLLQLTPRPDSATLSSALRLMVLSVVPWMLRQHWRYLQTYRKHRLSEHSRTPESQRIEWSHAQKTGQSLPEPFSPSSPLKKKKSALSLSDGDGDAYFDRDVPPPLSLFSRYTVTGHYGKEPDQCSLLLFAHRLNQIKVMSLIPTDVCLCWVTLRLQREVLSLRQTSVYRPLEKPVRKTMKSHWRSNHQWLEHSEKCCI